jgi:hypothetical protein
MVKMFVDIYAVECWRAMRAKYPAALQEVTVEKVGRSWRDAGTVEICR